MLRPGLLLLVWRVLVLLLVRLMLAPMLLVLLASRLLVLVLLMLALLRRPAGAGCLVGLQAQAAHLGLHMWVQDFKSIK